MGAALPNLTVSVPAPEKPQPEIVVDVFPVTKPAMGEMSVTPNPVQSGAALEELPRSPTATIRIASAPARDRALGDLNSFVAAHIGWRPRSSPPRRGRLRRRAGRPARTARRPGRHCPQPVSAGRHR